MLELTDSCSLFNTREQFLRSLTNQPLAGDRLIKYAVMPTLLYTQLRTACFNYILAGLSAHSIDVTNNGNFDEFVIENAELISSMSCVTPNGVIRPKIETISEFNSIHSVLSRIISFYDLNVARVRAPVSIRIVTSSDDPSILRRPRANNKLHSDFWTGAVCDFAILIPLFGSLDTIDVVFGEPTGMKPSFLQEVIDYSDGSGLYDSFTEYATRMQHQCLYLQDIFCLHGTRRSGKGARISLDFTLQSNEYDSTIRGHYENKFLSKDNHVPLSSWLEIGTKSLIYETESIETLRQNNFYSRQDVSKEPGVAVKTQTSDSLSIVHMCRELTLDSFAK